MYGIYQLYWIRMGRLGTNQTAYKNTYAASKAVEVAAKCRQTANLYHRSVFHTLLRTPFSIPCWIEMVKYD